LVRDVRVNDTDGDAEAEVNGWVYDSAGGFWFRGGVRFRRLRGTVLEVFDYGEYESLDVVGRVVVDAGAYIGDSAIYFALRGAKRVIAVELTPTPTPRCLKTSG